MTENKYHKGKIYTIRSPQTDKYYIGSTCNPLYKRLYKHKYDYKKYLTGEGNNITSFEIVKLNDCYIELLENYKCESRDELNKREGELIRLHKDNIVNKVIPDRTIKEWYQDNKVNLLIKKKEYHNNNRDELIKKKKIYNEKNKEKRLEYYQNNKDIINQKKQEKIICECGREISKSGKARHTRSKYHLSHIN